MSLVPSPPVNNPNEDTEVAIPWTDLICGSWYGSNARGSLIEYI